MTSDTRPLTPMPEPVTNHDQLARPSIHRYETVHEYQYPA
jgi:hypothetical protein